MMTPIPVHVVWYKRDLRVSDHAPLARASAAGPCIPLFVFEPEQWTQPEVDRTHFDFVTQSLRELDLNLTKLGGQLFVRTGEIVAVLEALHREFGLVYLHSHEETGGNWSCQRDRRVRAWCRDHGIVWTEYRQNGVTRGLKSRDRWAVLWQRFISQPIADVPASFSVPPTVQTEVFPEPHVLGLREDDFRNDYFEAWCTGQTGYPMIDACMRYLIAHRWINFRMRAMLMSFAAYQLWLHWREPAVFLARHFLDFEPGIHYPQSQMQSGVTGINTIRIYSSVKQGKDQVPEGHFVRAWVPELERIPLSYLFDPWRMSLDDQTRYGCQLGRDYSHPIVDPTESVRTAKERIYAIRKTEFASFAAEQVFQILGSRKRRDPIPKKSTNRPASQQQLWLPGMEDS